MASVPMAPVVKPKALFCPNCGGPVERRGFGYTLTAVCPQCLSVLDTSTPLITILQKIEERQRRTLLIPLGSRGKFEGATWEAIGMQARAVIVDGVAYEWEEYLLFNPFLGFRYLTQYNGHWNWVTPTEALPVRGAGLRPSVNFEQHSYRHFSSGDAFTTFILGEFPWRVKAGDKVRADDFIDPPHILSQESTPDELTWSSGVYTPAADVWKAFALPGSPPPARGVYLNQPTPYKSASGIWGHFLWMILALLGLMLFFAVFSKREKVLAESHSFSGAEKGEASFVTREFELTGRPSTVELAVDTNLDNNSTYFNFALINQDTGEAYDFGREVSYYHGVDDGESWSEGDQKSSLLLSSVPPGRYYLRVEPEMDSSAASVNYAISVRRDVPSYTWFLIAGGLLFIPPVWRTIRAAGFEKARWSESDYAPASSNDDDD